MTNGPSDPRPGSPAAVQLFEESTTRNISPVAAMQRVRVISPIIMHRNQVRLWMTRRPAARKPWGTKALGTKALGVKAVALKTTSAFS
jgi:hypothetical protein